MSEQVFGYSLKHQQKKHYIHIDMFIINVAENIEYQFCEERNNFWM